MDIESKIDLAARAPVQRENDDRRNERGEHAEHERRQRLPTEPGAEERRQLDVSRGERKTNHK